MPKFFLEYWALQPGKQLCEFSRPYGPTIKPQRRAPNATGFEENLYRLELGNGEAVDVFDKEDLKDIDDAAAVVIAKLHAKDYPLSTREMQALSLFVSSLLHRDPETVAALKARVTEDYGRFEEYTRQIAGRQPDDALTIARFIEGVGVYLPAQATLSVLRASIGNSQLHNFLESMIWEITDVSDSNIQLLTSDRPIIVNGYSINDSVSFVALAISPCVAVFGSTHEEVFSELKLKSSIEIATYLNTQVSRQASKHVYAVDDSPIEFVRDNMGQRSSPSLQKRIGLALSNRKASSARGHIEDEPRFREELQEMLDQARLLNPHAPPESPPR